MEEKCWIVKQVRILLLRITHNCRYIKLIEQATLSSKQTLIFLTVTKRTNIPLEALTTIVAYGQNTIEACTRYVWNKSLEFRNQVDMISMISLPNLFQSWSKPKHTPRRKRHSPNWWSKAMDRMMMEGKKKSWWRSRRWSRSWIRLRSQIITFTSVTLLQGIRLWQRILQANPSCLKALLACQSSQVALLHLKVVKILPGKVKITRVKSTLWTITFLTTKTCQS